jgi:hypothetical protein
VQPKNKSKSASAPTLPDPIVLLDKLHKISALRLRLNGETGTFCSFDPTGTATGDMRTRNFTEAVFRFDCFLQGARAALRALRTDTRAVEASPEPSAEQVAEAEFDLAQRREMAWVEAGSHAALTETVEVSV